MLVLFPDLVTWCAKCNGNKCFSRDPILEVDASDQFGGVIPLDEPSVV